ncbi:phosphoribosylglycinamide formyltransferase [Candidatus Micrarchaeota archaeon]|nr:phosphoribosylglycinamide formyltransferase [Candidatus Micrarchaeota archaeon]
MAISIAVLASGRGSNFQSIIDGVNEGDIKGEIRVLITDNPEAQAISRAEKNKIPVEIIRRKQFKSRENMDLKIKEILDVHGIDLVVLAGYMKIINSKELLDSYRYKIINIHPSLLPAFKGSTHAQTDAFEYGCKVSGLTIHFVTDDIDGGPIIYQKAADISECSSADEVAGKILSYENEAYRRVVGNFSKGKYVVNGRKVRYTD